MTTAAELKGRARAKRARADKLWRDAPQLRVDRFKKPYLDKIKRLYKEADQLDKQADRIAKR